MIEKPNCKVFPPDLQPTTYPASCDFADLGDPSHQHWCTRS